MDAFNLIHDRFDKNYIQKIRNQKKMLSLVQKSQSRNKIMNYKVWKFIINASDTISFLFSHNNQKVLINLSSNLF